MNPDTNPITPAAKPRRGPYIRLKECQRRIAASPSSYLAYCFLLPVLIMLVLYVAMELHPFGNGTVLVLDLNGQYVYFFEGLRDAVWGDGSLLYTFSRTLGGEFMGIYAYYLASPLSYIVALLPKSAMQEALLLMILLKVGLCGLSMGWYLHKHTAHASNPLVTAFAVMYALCAYAVVYQNNVMWIDAMFWLPVLTYAIERLIRFGRCKLFIVSLSLAIMSNYYIGYMLCLYVVLYFFYQLAAHPDEELNPAGLRCWRLRALLRIALSALVALAISAFVIIAAYYSLSFGKNAFSNPSWTFSPKFEFLDLFTKLLPGTYDTVRPEGLPLLYCGVLALLLIPVYFISRGIRTREKLASLGLLAAFVLSFIVSPLDLIWHGFQSPNWLNYRYSFMLCFLMLIWAYKGAGNLRAVGSKFILGVCAFWIVFAAVCNKLEFKSYLVSNEKLSVLETVWLTIFSVVILGTLLCLLVHTTHAKKRESIAGILLTAVCLELFCSGLACMVKLDEDVSYATYSNYHDYIGNLRPIVERVEEYDSGFYRMEKLSHRKFNDNMALGIRGISGSTSTLHADSIEFLRSLGYTSRSHLSQYLGGTPVSDSLLGIRYLIDSNDKPRLNRPYMTAVASTEHYTAYQNPYALSLAYGVDSSVSDFSADLYDDFFTRMNGLVGTMLGERESPIFRSVSQHELTLESCTSSGYGALLTYTASDAFATLRFSITAPESGEYFFYTPSMSPTEVSRSLDGGVTWEKYLGSNTNSIVSAGYFSQGETVEVLIRLEPEQTWKINRGTYFWYIDEEAMSTAFDALGRQPQLLIDGNSSEHHLTGTVTTEKTEQMMLTTLPYDEGWQIFVDGERVEIYEALDALLAFDISTAGAHTVEMRYFPASYKIGAVISAGGLTALICLCLIDAYRTKKKRKAGKSAAYTVTPWSLPDLDEEYENRLSLSEEELLPKSLKEQCAEARQSIRTLPSRIKGATVAALTKATARFSHTPLDTEATDDPDQNEGEN